MVTAGEKAITEKQKKWYQVNRVTGKGVDPNLGTEIDLSAAQETTANLVSFFAYRGNENADGLRSREVL